MPYGERIKRARRNAKLTQGELAAKIGKSLRMVQKYESGEVVPPVEVFKAIAETVDVEFEFLIATESHSSALVFFDWLESLGYKIAVYEEEDWRSVVLKDRNSGDSFVISDHALDEMRRAITSYTRFQIQEIIAQAKKEEEQKRRWRPQAATDDGDSHENK